MNVTERFSRAEREKLWRRFEWLREWLIRESPGECSREDLAREGNADGLRRDTFRFLSRFWIDALAPASQSRYHIEHQVVG